LKNKSLHKKALLLILSGIFFFITDSSFAQWVNDPSSNTKLVIDPVDPINIMALRDFDGGAYVFWQDKKGSPESDVYFIHFNKSGDVSFRADGKVVSTRGGIKEDPLAFVEPAGNSIVIWKGYDKKNNAELFVQKLSKNGLRLWQNEGIQLTENRIEKVDYSLRADKRGYAHISYITKNISSLNKFSVRFNTITSSGKFLSDSLKGPMQPVAVSAMSRPAPSRQ